MVEMASKKTKVISVRLPYDVIEQMKDNELNGKDAIELALNMRKTPEKMYRAKLRGLISDNKYHASMIALNNQAIDELKKKIGFEGTLEELENEILVSENDEAIQTTLERFESMKGTSKLDIHDFINSKSGKRIIDVQLKKTDLTIDDFVNLLIEKHEKSRQTTLDS